MYKSVPDALMKMLKSTGRMSRLYRGILPAALGAIPSSALYFGAYESCKTTLENLMLKGDDNDKDGKSTFRERFLVHGLAAASGNILSSSVFVPKEVIKQQLQYQAQSASSTTTGMTTSVMSVIQQKGIVGLYTGYGATLMRNIPSAMIRFVLYEELKRKFRGNADVAGGSCRHTSLATFGAGLLAGSTASFLMTPVDVLKTRMATGTCPLGVKNCMMYIVQSVGYRGLYAGAGSRMLWSGCFSAVGLASFEFIKGRLGVATKTPAITGKDGTDRGIAQGKRKISRRRRRRDVNI
jgi:hypothetical protein